MWWLRPLQRGFPSLLPENMLDLVARTYSLVEVGGLKGRGAERGRNFEQVFYALCDQRAIHLSERAGSRTVARGQSASRLPHEVDGATRSAEFITHWELKHLTSAVPKNELLIFNGKGLDFLQGGRRTAASTPMLRFLLSGSEVRDECRYFAILWGIMIVEPMRLPLPLLYEAVARGAAAWLSAAECDIVRERVYWACRPLQQVVAELHNWSCSLSGPSLYGPGALRVAKEILDVQEQIGATVFDYLDEHNHDWLDDAAEETWHAVGGW